MFNLADLDIAGWIVPVAAISGWAFITLYRLYLAGRTREHAHRERMAMIERGVTPPAETAAAAIDWRGGVSPNPVSRNRRTGIILIGVGVGLALMLGVIGTGGRSMGASAFLIVLGLAFLVIAMFDARSKRSGDRTPSIPGGDIRQ
jgi:hypothetical protein